METKELGQSLQPAGEWINVAQPWDHGITIVTLPFRDAAQLAASEMTKKAVQLAVPYRRPRFDPLVALGGLINA